jgi:hypothetical protein
MQTTIINKNRIEAKVAFFILIWGLASFILGYYKVFTFIPRPIFGFVVVIIQTSLVLAYLINTNFKEYCNSIPLKSIALFHVWRIFAGWVFLSYSGMLSQTFINNAAYGDIISGFLGLTVFLFGHTKLNYYIFNILGLLDFIIAVGTGITLTITGDPQMDSIVLLPLIIIPLFGVPLSGITHFISLARILKIKTTKITDIIE